MIRSDKILTGVLIGVVILVIAAFVLVAMRPADEYRTDDSALNVTYNYLLALRNKDYPKAYSYLSPNLPGYPADFNQFQRDVVTNSWQFMNEASSTIALRKGGESDLETKIYVTETEGQTALFSSSYQREMEFVLRLEQGQWKIRGGDGYFSWCWTNTGGCSR